MNPGQLDRRLSFQDRPKVKGSMGQEKTGPYAEVFFAWGKIAPLKSEDYFAAQQAGSAVDNEITIRARSGLARGMRIVSATRSFTVESWRPTPRGDYLIIRAIEQVG
jgi:SPP1 family predicted phage head-tail adaptor